jgi:hypothetical protein
MPRTGLVPRSSCQTGHGQRLRPRVTKCDEPDDRQARSRSGGECTVRSWRAPRSQPVRPGRALRGRELASVREGRVATSDGAPSQAGSPRRSLHAPARSPRPGSMPSMLSPGHRSGSAGEHHGRPHLSAAPTIAATKRTTTRPTTILIQRGCLDLYATARDLALARRTRPGESCRRYPRVGRQDSEPIGTPAGTRIAASTVVHGRTPRAQDRVMLKRLRWRAAFLISLVAVLTLGGCGVVHVHAAVVHCSKTQTSKNCPSTRGLVHVAIRDCAKTRTCPNTRGLG